ncbi:MAG: hypothetical protein ACRDPC_12675 [Solirubrobacteraceae bacterium]
MDPPLGRSYWAVAPFSPRPPFRLYAAGDEPREVGGPEQIVDAAKRGMSEFVLLTNVKARPVLVISPVLSEFDEVLALRLHRLEKIDDPGARERVRRGDDGGLFWLPPDTFPGLPTENAAIVSSMLRLPMTALDRRAELGALNENELRVLHERLVRAYRLRLDVMVIERARRLLEAAQARRSQS